MMDDLAKWRLEQICEGPRRRDRSIRGSGPAPGPRLLEEPGSSSASASLPVHLKSTEPRILLDVLNSPQEQFGGASGLLF